MRFAILNRDGSFREFRDYAERPPGRPAAILDVVVDADPVFNAATHKVIDDAPLIELAQARVRVPRVAVALTQAELDLAANRAERAEVLQVIAALRNGTGTTAQRFQRTEKVCAWLLTREALGTR